MLHQRIVKPKIVLKKTSINETLPVQFLYNVGLHAKNQPLLSTK